MGTQEPHASQILIVTQAFDPHTDELIVLLRYMGHHPVRLNTEAIPLDSFLSARFSTNEDHPGNNAHRALDTADHFTLLVDGRVIDARQIGAVWWRPPGAYQFGGSLSPEEGSLAGAETEQAMQGFWLALAAGGCYWMSEPSALKQAHNLPEQLRRAQHLGFALPRSLLSTHPGQVRAFFQETGGQLVCRLLSALSTTPQEKCHQPRAAAALIGEEHLATLEQMVCVPILFQEHLSAQRFYVVVVIGEQIFAAQSTGSSEPVPHWWSAQVSSLSYEPVSLSPALKERCRTLVHSYHLEFGVLRLALGEQGQIYFVALDPLGSFLWLEQHCPELRLCEALATQLLAGASREGAV